VLTGLFIWQQSVPFLPRIKTDDDEGAIVAGKDASAGFVNLLRRNVPAADLMQVCLEKWIDQVSGARRIHPGRLEEMQRLIAAENRLPPRDRNPVQLYNQFARILDHRHVPRQTDTSS